MLCVLCVLSVLCVCVCVCVCVFVFCLFVCFFWFFFFNDAVTDNVAVAVDVWMHNSVEVV